MLRAFDAVVDEQGIVRPVEPIGLPAGSRVLIVVLDELAGGVAEATLLSEPALAEDWNRPEEDEAWSHLQQLALS